jgi:C4-dicarboxylate transporter DctQ subunit
MVLLQVRTDQKTIVMQIPLSYLYTVLPVMGVCMFIRTIQIIYEDVNILLEEKNHKNQQVKTATN